MKFGIVSVFFIWEIIHSLLGGCSEMIIICITIWKLLFDSLDYKCPNQGILQKLTLHNYIILYISMLFYEKMNVFILSFYFLLLLVRCLLLLFVEITIDKKFHSLLLILSSIPFHWLFLIRKLLLLFILNLLSSPHLPSNYRLVQFSFDA